MEMETVNYNLMGEYAHQLVDLPEYIIEIIINYLDVETILELAFQHSYFSRYLPSDVYYGQYLGYNITTDDSPLVNNSNYSEKNKHIWEPEPATQQMIDDYLDNENDYSDEYQESDYHDDNFEAMMFEESFQRLGF